MRYVVRKIDAALIVERIELSDATKLLLITKTLARYSECQKF